MTDETAGPMCNDNSFLKYHQLYTRCKNVRVSVCHHWLTSPPLSCLYHLETVDCHPRPSLLSLSPSSLHHPISPSHQIDHATPQPSTLHYAAVWNKWDEKIGIVYFWLIICFNTEWNGLIIPLPYILVIHHDLVIFTKGNRYWYWMKASIVIFLFSRSCHMY